MREPDQQFLHVAKKLAGDASNEILLLLRNPILKHHKPDRSPVTEADLRSDEILRKGLAQAFPDHAILTEEAGLAGNPSSEFVWLVDPLDGTKAYAEGLPGFCVMVGLLKEGQPYLGVIMDPLDQRLYEAIRGQGAFLTYQGKRKQLHVSKRRQFSEMPLVVSTGFPEKELKAIQQKLDSELLPPINSVGIKVGLLVRQEADIYLNHHSVSLWDTCAPQVILEEAGGVITKLDGPPLQYSLTEPFSHHCKTLASNGQRHEELVKIFAPPRTARIPSQIP